ncbi:hypothetical protein CASFOL_037975 [Castilleja foliolosa]|uniref:Uncharacterized protein n=1 Tax=Castilleja foliolosa TaxID=1961234 RepID=A0ABD3BK65_9LAMI
MMDSTDVLQRWWIDVGLSELMSRAAQRGAERRLDSGGDGDLVG